MDHRKSQLLYLFVPLFERIEGEFRRRTGAPLWENRWPHQEPRLQRLHARLLEKYHKAFRRVL